jgi:AmmeMemoRadiSam system protein B
MVPIAIMSHDLNALRTVGVNIAHAISTQNLSSSVLLVASTDMSHYVPKKVAETKDRLAIEAILALDEDKLMDVVKRNNISMCGVGPVVVLIAAAKGLGAQHASLIKYQTSADASGDSTSVVGYAGLVIT